MGARRGLAAVFAASVCCGCPLPIHPGGWVSIPGRAAARLWVRDRSNVDVYARPGEAIVLVHQPSCTLTVSRSALPYTRFLDEHGVEPNRARIEHVRTRHNDPVTHVEWTVAGDPSTHTSVLFQWPARAAGALVCQGQATSAGELDCLRTTCMALEGKDVGPRGALY